MPSARLLSDNALKRAASFTAAATSGVLAASNLLHPRKSYAYRSTTTGAVLTASWASLEQFNMVALMFTSMSSQGTIRAQIFLNADGSGGTVYDSGVVPACPAPSVRLEGWTDAQAATAYAYGGGAHAVLFMPATYSGRRLVITLADPGNLAGFFEACFALAGLSWSPQYQADMGASMSRPDSGRPVSSDAGDDMVEPGFRSHQVQFSLSNMPPADRTQMANMLASLGTTYPFFLSIFPGNADASLERDHTVYGRLTSASALTITQAAAYSIPLTVVST